MVRRDRCSGLLAEDHTLSTVMMKRTKWSLSSRAGLLYSSSCQHGFLNPRSSTLRCSPSRSISPNMKLQGQSKENYHLWMLICISFHKCNIKWSGRYCEEKLHRPQQPKTNNLLCLLHCMEPTIHHLRLLVCREQGLLRVIAAHVHVYEH